jgi:hypothetical protein
MYSTYLGGNGLDVASAIATYLGGLDDEGATAIAVDSAGSAYITGGTDSLNFPVTGSLQPFNRGDVDIFATKLSATGSRLTFSTYLGGTALETAQDLALDNSGNVYLTGNTSSVDFLVVNAFQDRLRGIEGDTFLTKVNAAGNALIYSTYLGGGNLDGAFPWRSMPLAMPTSPV